MLPYLIRRAEENSDLLGGGATKERKLLKQELVRRIKVRLGLEKQEDNKHKANDQQPQPQQKKKLQA